MLNDYDQETPDFHHWTVEYTQRELTELVSSKLKMDLGDIVDLVIEQPSPRNPAFESIAFLDGLRIVVSARHAPGTRVRARISNRLPRVAFADPIDVIIP